ncbi:MAG: GNAT family N-acetyltransferase [Bacteroidales bacterium]
MEKFNIKTAEPSHIETIVNFQLLMAIESEGITLDQEILSKGVKAVFADPAKGKYFLCQQEGKVIASLLITYEWSDWRNGMVWWIQSVFVSPDYRKSGVFRAMFENIRQQALNDPGVRGIRLYVDNGNTPALQVYQNIGMNGDHYRVFEWMKD